MERNTPQESENQSDASETVRWSLRVPKPLADRIATSAKASGRTLVGQIEHELAIAERACTREDIQRAIIETLDPHLTRQGQYQIKHALAMEAFLNGFIGELKAVLRGDPRQGR